LLLLGFAHIAFAQKASPKALAPKPSPADFGTGKVPIEGSLSASNSTPAANGYVVLYLSATPLVSGPVELRFILPKQVAPAGTASTTKRFPSVAALETVSFSLPVQVLTVDPVNIVASAGVGQGERLTNRPFLITLNPPAVPAASTGRDGQSSDGRPIVIYKSGK
jgi:hypothetical protein